MGKKTYHIVDPETGEVVGEKRMGRIRQAYYKTPPNGRALFVLSLIPAFLMAASAVIGFILFFCRDHIPNRLSSVIFYVLVINAAISLLLIFLWSVLNELHLKKGSEAEEAESDQ